MQSLKTGKSCTIINNTGTVNNVQVQNMHTNLTWNQLVNSSGKCSFKHMELQDSVNEQSSTKKEKE